MTDRQMSAAAAELFRQVAPSLSRPERFLQQLRRNDPERSDLQRAVWRLFKIERKVVDEDSPIVRQIADLYRAGDFGEPSRAD